MTERPATIRHPANGGHLAGIALVCLMFSASVPALAAAPEPVGIVESLDGEPMVIRADADEPEPLGLRTPIYIQDIVETDEDSLVALVFIDDTAVSLGEDSTLEINEFLFDTDAETRTALFTMSEGIVKVTVERLLPDSTFEVQTSTTVASVRATEWIVEAVPDSTAVVALSGAVAVRSADPSIPGEVLLGPGEGVEVGMGEAPQAKGRWGGNRIARFKARTDID